MSLSSRLAAAIAAVALVATAALTLATTATGATSDTVGASGAEERTAPLKVTAKLSPYASVVQNSAVRVSGTTSYWRTPVQLQRMKGAGWVNAASGRSKANASYSFKVPTAKIGTSTYRVRAKFDGGRKPVYSAAVTLTVGGPLVGPLVLHNDRGYAVWTELLGDQRTERYVEGRVAGASTTSRVLTLTSTRTGDDVLHVFGDGMPDTVLLTTPCVMGESISPDGRYVTYGVGIVGGNLCFPPASLTLHDLTTDTKRQIAVPEQDQHFSTLGVPVYSRDGRHLFVQGDARGGAMSMYDVATGAAQRLPDVWSGDGDPYAMSAMEPTNLPSPAGTIVVRTVSSSYVLDDCPAGLYAVAYGTTQSPTCWNGDRFNYAEANQLAPSPDGATLAWITTVSGVKRYATAPAGDLSAVTVGAPLGHKAGDGLHMFWRSNRYLQTEDYLTGGESTLDLTTGTVWQGAPHGWFLE